MKDHQLNRLVEYVSIGGKELAGEGMNVLRGSFKMWKTGDVFTALGKVPVSRRCWRNIRKRKKNICTAIDHCLGTPRIVK